MKSEDRNKNFGRRVATLRETHGLTQKVLAEKLGIAAAVLGSKERGERAFRLDELVILTGIFHMSLEELVNEVHVDDGKPEDLGLSEEVVETLRTFREKHPEAMDSINYFLAYPGFLQLLSEYEKSLDLPDTGDPHALIEIRKAENGMYNAKMTPIQYKKIVELAFTALLRKAKAEHDRP